MGNNVAFDVVIGLIFIYLLYSLYATVLMEVFSSLFGLRARNLRYATRRMLMDDVKQENYFVDIGVQTIASLCQILGTKPPGLTNSALYDALWEQPAIKTLSGGGLSNTPSYISSEIFSKALIDSVKTDNIDLGLISAIEEGIENLKEGDTKKQLHSLLLEANNDLVKFEILIQKWYDETMDRATGWFKRTTQLFLFLIGIFLAFGFNVNTFDIIRKLSIDKEATAQLVKMATDFSQQQVAAGNEGAPNPPGTSADPAASEKLRELLEKNIKESQEVISSGWYISDKIEILAKKTEPSPLSDYKSLQLSLRTKDGKDTIVFARVHGTVDSVAFVKAKPVLSSNSATSVTVDPRSYKYHYITAHLWGYLVTILALSLGAPFWFDLLNKVIKLRSSLPAVSGQAVPLDKKNEVNATLKRAG